MKPDDVPTREQVVELVERLNEWAQNEEMIDQHFTQHGRVCNESASALTALSDTLLESDTRLRQLLFERAFWDGRTDSHTAAFHVELQRYREEYLRALVNMEIQRRDAAIDQARKDKT